MNFVFVESHQQCQDLKKNSSECLGYLILSIKLKYLNQ